LLDDETDLLQLNQALTAKYIQLICRQDPPTPPTPLQSILLSVPVHLQSILLNVLVHL